MNKSKLASTPQRNTSLNTSLLTPVRFPDSPSAHTPKTADQLAARQRLRKIIKTILDNHIKWMAAQKRGTTLCTSIEAIKRPILENRDKSSRDFTLYPDDLKVPCEKLQIITTIFPDVLDSALESHRQIEALHKLSANLKLLKTWPTIELLVNFAQLISAYRAEYSIKRKVMENIAHASSVEELVLHVCAWEFPTFVNDKFNLFFKYLKFEAELTEENK